MFYFGAIHWNTLFEIQFWIWIIRASLWNKNVTLKKNEAQTLITSFDLWELNFSVHNSSQLVIFGMMLQRIDKFT